jgi:succinate dehydrogenase/fumarate reductase flavoprotein subunit
VTAGPGFVLPEELKKVNMRDSLGDLVSTDVLVIGGGIAGLAAAITVKEESPGLEVLVVEKATTGWAGKANRGGGILAFITPEDTPEEFVSFHVHNVGCFLEDQELLGEYARTCNSVLECMDRWGARISKKPGGGWDYIKVPGAPLPWGLAGVDLDMCQRFLKHARGLGVKFLNKVSVVDLLKEGERVAGAIGFGVEDGACRLFQAGAVVLANGGQDFRVMPMWSCARGDGIAAAYRAGALMRNAEFGSFINMIWLDNHDVAYGAEDVMRDAAGEDVTAKYRPLPQPDICAMSGAGWHLEQQAGRGPVYEAADENLLGRGSEVIFTSGVVWERPVANAFWKRLWDKGALALKDPKRPEVAPGFIGELTPIEVDHEMATTVPGLFAVGDASYNGSAWTGAVPSPPGRIRGTGLMNAVWSARKGALAAAKDVAGMRARPAFDEGQAETLKRRMFAPLQRESGTAAIDLVHRVQEAIAPMKYSVWRSEERMKEALGMVMEARDELPSLKAGDPHGLAACNEAESMALCAEMFYRASLVRKESRGWFQREDYPEVDNRNWLKWIALHDSDGEMTTSLEDIPVNRYPIRP